MEIPGAWCRTRPAGDIRLQVWNNTIDLAQILEDPNQHTCTCAGERRIFVIRGVHLGTFCIEYAGPGACTNRHASEATGIAGRLPAGGTTPAVRNQGGEMKKAGTALLVLLV